MSSPIKPLDLPILDDEEEPVKSKKKNKLEPLDLPTLEDDSNKTSIDLRPKDPIFGTIYDALVALKDKTQNARTPADGSLGHAVQDKLLTDINVVSDVLTRPDKIVTGAAKGVKQLGQAIGEGIESSTGPLDAGKKVLKTLTVDLVNNLFVQPFVTNNAKILLDHFVARDPQGKPLDPNSSLLLKPEDVEAKFKETLTAIEAIGIAKLVGLSNPKALPKLVGRNADEAINSLTDNELVELVTATTAKPTALKSALRNASDFTTYGGLLGLGRGETSEERIANATADAITTFIGSFVFSKFTPISKNARDREIGLKNIARQVYAGRVADKLSKDMPSIEAAYTSSQILANALEGDELIATMANNIKSGEKLYIPDAPLLKKDIVDLDNVRVIQSKSGKTLVESKDGPVLQPDQIKQFQRFGTYKDAVVEIGGNEMLVDRIDGGSIPKVKLRTLDGKLQKKLVNLSDITHKIVPSAKRNITEASLDELGLLPHQQDLVNKWLDKAEDIRSWDALDIGIKAANKGFSVRYKDGNYELRNLVNRQLLGKFDNVDDAKIALDNSIAPIGNEILVGNNITSNGLSVNPSLPVVKPKAPNRFDLLVARVATSENKLTSLLKVPNQYFKHINTLWQGSGVYKKYVDLYSAEDAALLRRNKLALQYNKIVPTISKLPKETIADLYTARTTHSRDELLGVDLSSTYTGRLASAREVDVADNLLATLGDSESLSRTLDVITNAWDDAVIAGDPFENVFRELAKGSKLSETEIDVGLKFSKVVGDALQTPLDDFSIGHVVEIARATLDKTPSRSEYIKQKGWAANGPEVKVLNELDKLYKEAAETFEIDPKARLNRYLPRQYQRDPVETNTALNAQQRRMLLGENSDFQHALHRLGLRDDYSTDILDVTRKYINAGVRKKWLLPAIKDFVSEIENTSQQIQQSYQKANPTASPGAITNASRGFRDKAFKFLNDFQHHTPDEQLFAEAGLDAYLEHIGVTDKGKRSTLGRTAQSVFSVSALGFMPLQGVRDIVYPLQLHSILFGANKTKRMIELYHQGLQNNPDLITDLRQYGYIPSELQKLLSDEVVDIRVPGADPKLQTKIMDGLHNLSKAGGKAFDRFQEVGFFMSGQAKAYQAAHSMAFLERYETVSQAYRSFLRHKDEGRFAKEVGLYKYSAPAQQQFTRLINSGNPVEAAVMLGKYTGHEFVGRLGYATHPIGWGTQTGRLITQFGQWPINQLHMLAQVAAKGDVGVYARGAAAYAGLMAASVASGVNLSQWTVSPENFGYLGGPLVGLTSAFVNAAMAGDPAVREFYQQYITNRFNPITNPKQIFIPIPFQFWNMLEGMGLYEQSETQGMLLRDNPFLAGAKFLGFSVRPIKSLYGIDLE